MHSSYRSTHRERRIPTLTVIAFFGLFAIWGTASAVNAIRQPIISPLADEKPATKESSILNVFGKKKNPEDLGKKINDALQNKWKNYSILVIDYTSPFELAINDRVTYTAASVNKIPILAALYYNAQKGDIDLDKTITIQKDDIQDYGTGSIRYDPPGSTYTIQTLARLMMQKSDNTAAYVLEKYIVGADEIQNLVNTWGLTQTDIQNNKTSNRDMALLMEKIYSGKIAGTSYTQEMLALFQDTDFEDRLPGKLPDSAQVYHKIGTQLGTVHDVGIIKDRNLLYYIGIFTNDIRDEEQAAEQLATVSKVVYDFMR